MKHITRIVIVGVFLLSLLSGCTGVSQPPQQELSVGMILGRGGLGDKSFNDASYAGLQEAEKRFGINYEVVDFTTDEAN